MAGAFAGSVASNLVAKLGEYLFAPIGRQFGYVLCYKSYVQDLQNEFKELNAARKRVQISVNEAECNGKCIHTDVENWLEDVKEETDKADNLLKRGASGKDACFRGWLPNPVVRHPIGRKVKKITKVIQGLHEKSGNIKFQEVSYERPPPGIIPATTSAARPVDSKEDVLVSRAKIMEDGERQIKKDRKPIDMVAKANGSRNPDLKRIQGDIMEDVMKAIVDDKVCGVGVWGAGGVGKSKFLEDVERRIRKDRKPFHVVAKANVSRNPDLKRIQGEIAYALGLKLMNEETTRGRADRLNEKLESDPKKKILIILDNLWKKLDLKEIGIPCHDDNKARGCKLLITSRYRDVLRTDMSTDREFRLDELEQGEARRLFERTLGDRVNDPDFKPLVDGVVKNCGGLPLLILSAAKRLKHGGMAEWRNALTNKEVLNAKSIVELNYNDLEDERMRSLFLICALSSGIIFMRCSLGYCVGLGIYKKFKTIEDARDMLIMDIHSLQDSSLLLDSDDKEMFRMHDIFVDVAISIASAQWNALIGKEDYGFKEWSKDELRKCTAISFHWVGIDELPEKLDCPNLRMLLLSESNPSIKIPASFFESTTNLQVLDITGLSLTSLPSSIEFLKNLKSLYLDYCHLEDVTILGKLKGLQFLSFHGSEIDRLPKEIGGLTELRFLDLTRCTWLKIIEPGVLGSLVNLEELYMEDSFDQWEAEGEAPQSNASLAELKNMKKLRTLYIAIPHSAFLPRDLPFGKLNKHKIQIGDVWDWSSKYKEPKTLKLKLDSGNLLLEEWVHKCLQKTQDLHLDGLQDGIDSIHDLCAEQFRELKYLHVQNSPSFKYLVCSAENVQCHAFTRLESLFLENLNNLEKLCRGCLAPESFSKLKIVKVDNCGEIKHLFPWCMKRIISQLEENKISRCHQTHQIAADAEANEDGDEIDDDTKVKWCNLRSLTLQNLPKMTSFCETVHPSINFFDGQQITNLQNLETITIEGCQSIQGLFDLEGLTISGEVEILSRLRELSLSDLPSLGHLWNKNPRKTLCFKNLRTLKVQNCEKLRFLFSSSMAKALGQIKEIEIVRCELMEEIIDLQEKESKKAASTDTLEFPFLTSLSLEGLPNLGTFCYGKYDIHYPSLTRLKISRCPKMKTFSSFEGKQQSMTGDTGLQQAPGHINSGLSLPIFFNEKVHFPSLEELELSSMCELKRIWPDQLHRQSFRKLASLTVERCKNLSHVFPSNSVDWFQSLNILKVVGCPSLEKLFEPVSLNTEKGQKPLVLPALKKVNVRHCHSLQYLFSTATAKTLEKLEVLDVSYCKKLWSIIVMEEGKGKIMETLKFRHLSTLKLGDLEKLISFSSASCAGEGLHPLFDEKLSFPKLEELQIKGIPLKELWYDKILAESFGQLKVLEVKQCPNLLNVIPSILGKSLLHRMESLTVEECPRLRNLFTMSMAESLVQLRYLGLGGCGEMEDIVAREEETPLEAAGIIVIPQLVTLHLHKMPKLRSFCNGKQISKWPSLKEFIIEDCKAVEVILGDVNCRRPDGSILTQQPLLLVEKVEFPSMESMKISHMDNVEKIWFGELASNAFTKLKTLVVEYCEKLPSIFSSHTILTRFQNLEKLTVTDCGHLEVVFHVQEVNFSEGHCISTFQLRELVLRRLPKMKHLWSGLPQGGLTFGCLRSMEVFKCESLKSLFPSLVTKSMTQLEELLVHDCGVEEIIVEEDGVGMNASDLFFPQLTDLRLLELLELRRFSRNSHTSTWPLLKQLRVRHCGKMRPFSLACEFESCQITTTSENQLALFSFEKVIPRLEGLTLAREDVEMMPQHFISGNIRDLTLACYHDENDAFPSNFLLHKFPNLEELLVRCSSFEEIFSEDAYGHGEGEATPSGGLTDVQRPLKALRNLKRLDLYELCNLRRVWKDGSLMAEILKQIQFLIILECPSLSIILPSATSFQRLTQLNVEDCAGLVHMGTCSAMTNLVHLTWLTLSNCGAMEDVVKDDGDGAEEISFPKLEELILDGLPSLESFSPTNCALWFPSLERVVVTRCPKMTIFCKGALRTPNLDKLLLSDEDDEWRWEGDLNTTIQTLST